MRLSYLGSTCQYRLARRLALSSTETIALTGAAVRPALARSNCALGLLATAASPRFYASAFNPRRLALRSAAAPSATAPFPINWERYPYRRFRGPAPSRLTQISGISTGRAATTNGTGTADDNTNTAARIGRDCCQPAYLCYDAYWPPPPTVLGPLLVAPREEEVIQDTDRSATTERAAAAAAAAAAASEEVGLVPPAAVPSDMVSAVAASAVEDPFSMDLREIAAAAAATAAAGAPGAADGGKAAPAVDVTRHNFEVMLPVVHRYLAACDFFAFDCEMTGLFLEGHNENYLDDMQDRYSRTAASAQSFVINQFGLSCFRRLEELGPAGEPRYVAATFNFYLFPRPPEGAAFGASRRFVCDAGSLTFLANQDFDFNRCIYDGVPFVPVRQRDEMLRQLDRENGGGGEGGGGRTDVALTKPEDQEFVRSLLEDVRRWLDEQSSEPLDLPPVNRYLRLLTYQALARPESFGGPPGGSPDWHPGFHVKKVQDERNWTRVRLVRATAAESAALEAAERAEKRAAVAATAGFAAVWEAMRECGRPGVGHNCMFDVAYGIAQFGEGRLPLTWEGFKRAAAYWFRGGLYDTKHICRQLPEVLGSETSLSTMFRCLVPPPQQQQEDATVKADAATPTTPTTTPAAVTTIPTTSGHPALPARLVVSHARGFEKYVAVAAGQLAHEAGYDAFMTGSVFVALEALLAGSATAPVPAADAGADAAVTGLEAATVDAMLVDAPPPYATVQPYMWRLNVTRSDLPYALLRPAVPGDPTTAEPVPERPLVFHLGALSFGTRAGDIYRAFEETGLGKVRITFLPGNNALVELESEEAAARLRQGGLMEDRGLCAEVLPYAQYRARKDEMLAAGTWPLHGYGGAPRPGPAGAGGRPAGAVPAGGAAAPGPAAAAAASPGVQRAAKRARVEVEEAGDEPAQPQEKEGHRQCVVM